MEVVRVDLRYFPSQNKNALQPGVFVLVSIRILNISGSADSY